MLLDQCDGTTLQAYLDEWTLKKNSQLEARVAELTAEAALAKAEAAEAKTTAEARVAEAQAMVAAYLAEAAKFAEKWQKIAGMKGIAVKKVSRTDAGIYQPASALLGFGA